jgi:multicomponent Na+:H+ antiporter subunit D
LDCRRAGAYLAKKLLLQAATETGQWWWAAAIQAGGILTSSYVLLVLVHALTTVNVSVTLRVPVPRLQEAAAVALALCALLLGLVPWQAYLPVPSEAQSIPLSIEVILGGLWPILGGGVIAILMGRWGNRLSGVTSWERVAAVIGPARRVALSLAGWIERADGTLRQWPMAGLALLAVAILFGAAMLAGR